jgi:branched-chain amino acid transport system permease protein
MSMTLLSQAMLNGLSLAMVYVLIALGLTLIFSIFNIINFAHGEFYMLGAYAAFYTVALAGIGYFPSILVAFVFVGVAGLIAERLIFRRLRGQTLNAFIVSLGLLWIMQAGAQLMFGVQEKTVPSAFSGILRWGGIIISVERFVVISTAIVLIALLYFFLEFTRLGRAIRAVAQDDEAAALQGVNTEMVAMLVFALGCAMAGAAGAMLAPVFAIGPTMGELPVLKGFVIIIIGGMGNLPGAVVGGVLLGILEGIGAVYMGSAAVNILGFLAVITVLLLRPQGLANVS